MVEGCVETGTVGARKVFGGKDEVTNIDEDAVGLGSTTREDEGIGKEEFDIVCC